MLLLVGLLFGQDRQRDVPIQADIARDAYELYSDVYRHAMRCDELKPEEVLVIDRTAATFSKEAYNAYLDRLRPKSAEERELIGNLVELMRTSYVWENRFAPGRAYRILTDDERGILDDCKFRGYAGHPNRPECGDYTNVVFVRGLSTPSFNKAHTRALVFTRRNCGGLLCGGHEFSEYRKTQLGWKRVDAPFTDGCIEQ